MRTLSILPYLIQASVDLGGHVVLPGGVELWLTTTLDCLSLRYTSAPLGSSHGMVLVRASKRGEESSPAKYRVASMSDREDGGEGEVLSGQLPIRKRGQKKGLSTESWR